MSRLPVPRRQRRRSKAVAQTKWGIEFRQLLGRFLDVCDAIDFAHSRDVLHRDLKPANIMLGPYGETLVVDWGLAKVIGKRTSHAAGETAKFDPVRRGHPTRLPGRPNRARPIGTPSYMSPEQATGSIDQLGPASDVYSLGRNPLRAAHRPGRLPPGRKLRSHREGAQG